MRTIASWKYRYLEPGNLQIHREGIQCTTCSKSRKGHKLCREQRMQSPEKNDQIYFVGEPLCLMTEGGVTTSAGRTVGMG